MSEVQEKRERPFTLAIEGGSVLNGYVELQGAKNHTLNILPLALIREGVTIFRNVPDLTDVDVTLKIFKLLGARVEWDKKAGELRVDATNLSSVTVPRDLTLQISSAKQLIPVMVGRFGEFTTFPSGGDVIDTGKDGDRFGFSTQVLASYKRFGIASEQNPDGSFTFKKIHQVENGYNTLKLDYPFFGLTVQALYAFASSPTKEGFTIENANWEPEVQQIAESLHQAGVEVSSQTDDAGKTTLKLSKGELSKQEQEVSIMSDPNALMSYACAVVATRGKVDFMNVEYNDKVKKIVGLLEELGVDVQYSVDAKKLSVNAEGKVLRPLKLRSDFWPHGNCHTDWQQLLSAVLAGVEGESTVEENVYPQRFSVDFPKGVNVQRDAGDTRFRDVGVHKITITGTGAYQGVEGDCPPDVRGATAMLILALGAQGRSILSKCNPLKRGLEPSFIDNLNKMGASIDVV